MLTHIRLGNFKCFDELALHPRRITVLIGPNGAGKSSVLQALMFLRQSLGHEDPQWQGPFVNLVGFPQALYSGAAERELAIAFKGARGLADMRRDFVYRAAFSEEGLRTNIGGVKWGSHQFYVEWHRGKSQDETRVGFDYYRGRFEYEVTGSPVIGKPHENVQGTVTGPSPGQEEAVQVQQKLLATIRKQYGLGGLAPRFADSFSTATSLLQAPSTKSIRPTLTIASRPGLPVHLATTTMREIVLQHSPRESRVSLSSKVLQKEDS